MASSSGTTTTTTTSSGSDPIQNSGSDEDLQRLMDQRKRKRMVSNRESARRSRLRKQKHLDELMTQLSQLRKENNQIIGNVSITMQHFTSLEAKNSVLKAQLAELGHRLESLNQMIAFMNQPINDTATGGGFVEEMYGGYGGYGGGELIDELMNNSVSCLYANQPILACIAEMI